MLPDFDAESPKSCRLPKITAGSETAAEAKKTRRRFRTGRNKHRGTAQAAPPNRNGKLLVQRQREGFLNGNHLFLNIIVVAVALAGGNHIVPQLLKLLVALGRTRTASCPASSQERTERAFPCGVTHIREGVGEGRHHGNAGGILLIQAAVELNAVGRAVGVFFAPSLAPAQWHSAPHSRASPCRSRNRSCRAPSAPA